MSIAKLVGVILVLGLVQTGWAPEAQAAGWGHGDDGRRRESHERDGGRRRDSHFREGGWNIGGRERFRNLEREHARDRNWALDRRHRLNHYYPRRGFTVRELPRGYRVFRHRHDRYFFSDGIWYRHSLNGYVVVTPPIGLYVTLLPPFYSTIWYDGVPYYYADGVYYRWLPDRDVYVVSEPPPENQVAEEPVVPQQLFIYPKEGQSAEKQSTDRYECHSWSVGQTGFDPTQPGGNVPADENAAKRADYQRAMKACLEARGYSVQ